MFSLGNFNHIVKSVTHAFVKHLIYRKLYAISCSSGASRALNAVGRARWVQQHAKAGSEPLLPNTHRHKISSDCPNWDTGAQKH